MHENLFAVGAAEDPDEEQEQEQPIPELEEFDEEELDDIFDRLENGS